MELRVYFRLRSGQKEQPGKKQLQIRLTSDGVTVSDYASGIYVRPSLWDQKDQQAKGRSRESADINERLSEVELAHRDILRSLKARYGRGDGPRPTAELIKSEFLTPGATDPDLLMFFDGYYSFCESLINTPDGKAKKTFDRLRTAKKYLISFVAHYQQEKGLRGRFAVSQVSAAFGKQFFAWLQTGRPICEKTMAKGAKSMDKHTKAMGKDAAIKYLSVLRDCLQHAVESDLLSQNPLDRVRPKRGKPKEVYFLSEPQVQALLAITTNDEQLDTVLWWVRLMLYTGLDYVDAVRYARARHEFEVGTGAGVIIHIRRAKPPRAYCEIPLHPIVEILFAQHPDGPSGPVLADINRHLKVIQGQIGFAGADPTGKPYRLTSKILRKTAGAIFLRIGFRIEAVSKLLGHSSIRTSLAHYISVKALSMEGEMSNVRAANRAIEMGSEG